MPKPDVLGAVLSSSGLTPSNSFVVETPPATAGDQLVIVAFYDPSGLQGTVVPPTATWTEVGGDHTWKLFALQRTQTVQPSYTFTLSGKAVRGWVALATSVMAAGPPSDFVQGAASGSAGDYTVRETTVLLFFGCIHRTLRDGPLTGTVTPTPETGWVIWLATYTEVSVTPTTAAGGDTQQGVFGVILSNSSTASYDPLEILCETHGGGNTQFKWAAVQVKWVTPSWEFFPLLGA